MTLISFNTVAAILEISWEFRATHRAEEDKLRSLRSSCWCEARITFCPWLKQNSAGRPNYWSDHPHYHPTPPTPAITSLLPVQKTKPTTHRNVHVDQLNRGWPGANPAGWCQWLATWVRWRGLPAARPRTHWAPVPSGGRHTRFLPRPLSDFLRPSSRGS